MKLMSFSWLEMRSTTTSTAGIVIVARHCTRDMLPLSPLSLKGPVAWVAWTDHRRLTMQRIAMSIKINATVAQDRQESFTAAPSPLAVLGASWPCASLGGGTGQDEVRRCCFKTPKWWSSCQGHSDEASRTLGAPEAPTSRRHFGVKKVAIGFPVAVGHDEHLEVLFALNKSNG